MLTEPKYPILLTPPEYHIKTKTIQLSTDAEFAEKFDVWADICRAIFNKTTHECTLDDELGRRIYMPYKRKKGIFFDDGSYKLAQKVAGKMAVDTSEVLNKVRSQLDDNMWMYESQPSIKHTRFKMEKCLTKMRGSIKHYWSHLCPVQYQRGAIMEGVNAADTAIQRNSDYIPNRKSNSLFCFSNQVINWKGDRLLKVPGFTLRTKQNIPKDWDMRSFQIVETTPYVLRGKPSQHRSFDIHIQIRIKVKKTPKNVLARAVDIGGKHVAATADTLRNTTLQTIPNDLLDEIRHLQSKRDKYRKGHHSWKELDRQLRIKWQKWNNVKKNMHQQGAAYVVNGVRMIILEGIDFNALRKAGGNRKKRMNDMLSNAGVGGFKHQVILDAIKHSSYILLVNPKNSSNECVLCKYTDKENRASRDAIICLSCGDEAHADLSAACVLLKRGVSYLVDGAEGQAVWRRRADQYEQPKQWEAWPRVRDVETSHMRWGRQKVTYVEVLP